MNRLRSFPGLVLASTLLAAGPAHTVTVTTGIDGNNSAMGATAHGCLQLLTISVGEGENCMYNGGPNFIEVPVGSGNFPLQPFGESTGPFSQVRYYSYAATPESFDNVVLPEGDPGKFAPAPGDGKIRQVIGGSITVDDNDTPVGDDDRISFTLTMTSPDGGDIVRSLGTDLADRYTSMTQVLALTPVDSASANALGGFDYVIGSRGFPTLLQFTDATADGGVCVDDFFGDMECDASFGNNMNGDPLRWQPWTRNGGDSGAAGIGSLEGNIGPRTSGTLENPDCEQETGTSACTESKTSFAPLAIGPNMAPGTGNVTAEDVGWDHVYLFVSTDTDGNVVSAEGFNVQGYQVFGENVACGNDVGATQVCNSWIAGHFTIAGAMAVDDSVDTSIDTPVTIDILANDTGFTDDVTVSLPGGGTTGNGGAVVINGTNPGPQAGIDVTYTSATSFSGIDTFDYQITDGTTTSSATVTVNVLAGANDDSASTRINSSTSIPVGANDFGFADPVTVTVTVPPNMGGTIDAIVGSGGPAANVTIDYTPVAIPGTPTYTETFTYEITDSAMESDTAVVTVMVNNEVPNAVAANASAGEGEDAVTDVSALPGVNLGDAPSVVAVTANPANGVVSVTGTVLTYSPNGFFTGSDSYDYTIADVDGETSTASVSVTIGPKRVPTAVPDNDGVDQGDSVVIDVLANDLAGSGALAAHTVAISAAPTSGSATVGAGNQVTYTPDVDFFGTDTFQYSLTDLDGDSSVTTVTVDVDRVVLEVPLPSGSGISPLTTIGLLLLPWLRRRRKSSKLA